MSNSKTKHTPGPWVIGQSGDLDTPIFCNGKDAINVFAGETGQLQAEANARLIAAAPEMLEALERIIDQIDSTTSRVSNNYELLHAILIGARTAVAKAKGGAE